MALLVQLTAVVVLLNLLAASKADSVSFVSREKTLCSSINSTHSLECLAPYFCCQKFGQYHCCRETSRLDWYRFNIWNMWYFWFVVIFVMMTCFGGCGYYRRRRWMLLQGPNGQHHAQSAGLPMFRLWSSDLDHAARTGDRDGRRTRNGPGRRSRDVERAGSSGLVDGETERTRFPVVAAGQRLASGAFVTPTLDPNFLYIPGGPSQFQPPAYSDVVKEPAPYSPPEGDPPPYDGPAPADADGDADAVANQTSAGRNTGRS